MEHNDHYTDNKHHAAQSVVTGIIDGLTVPFAISAALTALSKSAADVFLVCFSLAVAYSLTMGIGAYYSGKKYEPAKNNISSAFIVCISYITGGFVAVAAFLFFDNTETAFKIAVPITLVALFVSGYTESRINNANVLLGALRAAFIASVAALGAFVIGLLFR